MKRPLKTLLRGLIGLALLAGVIWLAHPARLIGQLRHAHGGWVLAGLLAAIVSNVISAWRWRALAIWLGAPVRLGFADAGRWYFQAVGLNVLLPGAVVGGDVYRAVMLGRAGGNALAASWSVALDRVSGLWMLCAISGLGGAACAPVLTPALGRLWPLPPGAFAVLCLAVTVIWLLLPWGLLALLRRGAETAPPRWLGPLAQAARQPDFGVQLTVQMLASTLVQVFSALALALGGLALNVHLPLAAWAFAIAPIFLMATLPVSVGGWGTREAAAAAALAPFGVPVAAAVGAGLLYGVFG
ncbi:MAG: flippase-like domain-containing protein, partial [Burkholderiaceae bacterium]|nr:flippase-like domain-containing protein [Burkholderiaceae bacterium]